MLTKQRTRMIPTFPLSLVGVGCHLCVKPRNLFGLLILQLSLPTCRRLDNDDLWRKENEVCILHALISGCMILSIEHVQHVYDSLRNANAQICKIMTLESSLKEMLRSYLCSKGLVHEKPIVHYIFPRSRSRKRASS